MRRFNGLHRVLGVLICGASVTTLAWAADAPATEKDQSIEVTGKLETGVMAIGGETTGITITVKDGVAYELDLQKDDKLAKLADELKGKNVTVKGTLYAVKGVERGERKIIKVASLIKAPAAEKPN